MLDLLRQAHLAAVAITIAGGEIAVQAAWKCGQGAQRDLIPRVHAHLLASRPV